MFDTYRMEARPSTVSHVHNVTEKKAPTDESVRLLREMESAARAEVIKSVSTVDNSINAVVHFMREHLSCEDRFKVIYSINGKQITTDYRANDWHSKVHTVDALIEAVATDIAKHILAKPLGDLMRGTK